MIIGLTGTNAAGKGTVATYLRRKGFKYYSLSDELRSLLRKKKVKATRSNMITWGNHYRSKKGNGYLATLAIMKMADGKAIVDSIRNPGEITELKKLTGFYLIAVDAPPRVRFERARRRMSLRDQKTYGEFVASQKKELSGKGPEQQLNACMKRADFRISNGSDLSNLYKKVDATIRKIPDKDDIKR